MPEEPNQPNQIDLLTVGELISLKEAAEGETILLAVLAPILRRIL